MRSVRSFETGLIVTYKIVNFAAFRFQRVSDFSGNFFA